MSAFLCVALLISGCSKKETSEDTTKTTTEATSKEQVTSIEETEEETSSESSSSETFMPPDNLIKELVAGMKQDRAANSDMVMMLCENGNYKMVNIASAITEITPLLIEYEFSEEYLNDRKEYDESAKNMTLDEFREVQKKQFATKEFDKYLDDNYHLKERPKGRVVVSVYSELRDIFDDDAVMEECVRAAFSLFDTDPRLKERLDDALYGDYVHGNTAQYMGIMIGFDADQNILVQAGVESFNGDEIMAETVISNDNAKAQNHFQGEANIRIENIFRSKYAAGELELKLDESEAKVLFDRLEALREGSSASSSELEEQVRKSAPVMITFQDSFKSRYIYMNDGIWRYSSMTFHFDTYFRPEDQEASTRLIDELCMQASLPVISDIRDLAGTLKADFSKSYDSPTLSDVYPKGNYQAVVFHVNQDSYWYYLHSEDSEGGVFYFEEMHSDLTSGSGQTNVFSADEYEYAGIPGEMYYRPDTTDVFYPADGFAGHGSLSYLLKEKEDAYQFQYGVDVSNDETTYRCDLYQNSKYRLAVILDEKGVPFTGWRWSEIGENWDDSSENMPIQPGLGVIRDIVTQDWDPEIEEYLEHARAHLAGQNGQGGQDGKNGQGAPGTGSGSDSSATKSAADWIREDQDAEGFPDLTGKIKKGDSIDHSPVMKDFLDYLDNDGPYSLEYWAFGCFKKYHGVLTVKDMDFYHSVIVRSHDNSSDFDFLYVALGDYIYQGSIEAPNRYPKEDSFDEREVRLQLPDPLTPEKEHTFKRAYEGAIEGQAYTIEEWSVGEKDVIYYCQDGRLVGFRSVENGYTMFYHVVGFSESADEDLLVVPGN